VSAESALRRAWGLENPIAEVLLWPLSLLSMLFGAGVAMRGAAYARGLLRREALPVPVISVGNLAVGGTGKTPAVIALARALGGRGRRVGVLARGYKGTVREGALLVSDGNRLLADAATAGDEPVLLARALPGVPVAVGPRRARAGRLLLERAGADLLLLDDGFQHRRLVRDADVVLVDGDAPFGNGHLLPRGPLRESPCALARADAVLVRAVAGEPPPLEAIHCYTAAHVGAAHTRVTGVLDADFHTAPDLAGVPVLGAAGIARPERFRATLAQTGARVLDFVPYPDHMAYTAADAAALGDRARAAGAEAVAVTAKDAVKLGALWPAGAPPLRVVEVALVFDDPRLVEEVVAVAEARFAARAARGGR
jgi:tetraacyldisaccharide 4'-kinase